MTTAHQCHCDTASDVCGFQTEFFLTEALMQQLILWRKRLEDKIFTAGLDRMESADLDFLNGRLPIGVEAQS